MGTTTHRTRYWNSDDTSTAVQFRTDAEPFVWLHCNLGWIPVGNAPDEVNAAERFAEEIAEGYKLTEQPEETARYFAGWE